jgi:hypothetical protein
MPNIKTFQPAFDMPTTAEEALAVLEKWSKPSTMTFSSERAKRVYEILKAQSNILNTCLERLEEK